MILLREGRQVCCSVGRSFDVMCVVYSFSGILVCKKKKNVVLIQSCAADQAHLRSHSGPGASEALIEHVSLQARAFGRRRCHHFGKNTDFDVPLCLPASFLTFGKVNDSPPQTDIFLREGGPPHPPPLIFVSAGPPPQTDIFWGGGGGRGSNQNPTCATFWET